MNQPRQQSIRQSSHEGVRAAEPRSWRTLLLAFALSALPLQCAAQLPETGLEGLGTKVSDEELGEMRGKFISREGIAYFGVSLHTSWQGADGITTFATLLFNVSFAGGNGQGSVPQLLIGWSREGDESMDVSGFGAAAADSYVAISGNTVIPVGGLGAVQGAVQSNEIAGTDNRVHNAMSIAVVPINAVSAPQTNGLTAVTSTTTQTFEDGDTVRFILEPGQIALALSGQGGTDAVRQSLDSDLGQAAQHVLLNSNFNTVNNHFGITVGIDELRQIDRISVDSALAAMKGRGF